MAEQATQGASWDDDAADEADPSAALAVTVRDCLPVFPILTRQLSDTIRLAETAIVQVCTRFQDIDARSLARIGQVEKSFGAGGHDDDENGNMESMCRHARSVLTTLLDHLHSASRFSQEAARTIQRTSDTLAGIDGLLTAVDQIVVRARLLAMNAKIEAVRSGAQGAAFGVVADETRTLATQVGGTIGSIRGILERVRAEVSDTAATLHSQATASHQVVESGNQDVERVLRLIASTHAAMQQSLEAGVAQSQAMSRDVSQAVVALQFQDIMSQRVSHVVQTIEEIHTQLADQLDGGDPQAAAAAGPGWAERLSERYTMADERHVHAQSLGTPAPSDLGGNVELF